MSEILYFIQIFCIFVGKSATFPVFWAATPGRARSVLLCYAQKAVSLSQNHPSISLAFFSILQKTWQKDHPQTPFPAQSVPRETVAGGHRSFCGSGVQLCGQLGVHSALLCLIGGHGLIGQCGALAVDGENGAHLADDALHFLIIRCLHRIQSAASG